LAWVDNCISCHILRSAPLIRPEDSYHPSLEVFFNYIPQDSLKPQPTQPLSFSFKKTKINTTWNDIIPKSISSPCELDHIVDTFLSTLYEYFETLAPRCKPASRVCSSWFNAFLSVLRKKKSHLYKKYKKSLSLHHYIDYTNCRYRYQHCCNVAYRNYLLSISKNIRSDPKSFWNAVNSKKQTSSLPSTLKFDNEIAITPSDCLTCLLGFSGLFIAVQL